MRSHHLLTIGAIRARMLALIDIGELMEERAAAAESLRQQVTGSNAVVPCFSAAAAVH